MAIPSPSARLSACTICGSDLFCLLTRVQHSQWSFWCKHRKQIIIKLLDAQFQPLTWLESDIKQGGNKWGICLNPWLLSTESVQINSLSYQPLQGLRLSYIKSQKMYPLIHLAVSWPHLRHLCSSRKVFTRSIGFLYTTIHKVSPSCSKYYPMGSIRLVTTRNWDVLLSVKYTSNLCNIVWKKKLKYSIDNFRYWLYFAYIGFDKILKLVLPISFYFFKSMVYQKIQNDLCGTHLNTYSISIKKGLFRS